MRHDAVVAALYAALGALLGAAVSWYSPELWRLACVVAGATLGAMLAPTEVSR